MLLAYRETRMTQLCLTDTAPRLTGWPDARTGKFNGRRRLGGLHCANRWFSGRAGRVTRDVNDAERLCRDPAMRWVVGDRAISGSAASASQMGRFETKWLSRAENLTALADLPGQWIDKVRQRRKPKTVILDMDLSESPTYGEQEGSAYNGHFRLHLAWGFGRQGLIHGMLSFPAVERSEGSLPSGAVIAPQPCIR